MDAKEIRDLVAGNFSEYLNVTAETLTRPQMHFMPVASEASQSDGIDASGRSANKLNPKLLSFALTSMFIGISLNSLLGTTAAGIPLIILEFVGVILWLVYAVFIHLLSKLARGIGTVIETVSVTVQLFATLYVTSSLLTLLVGSFISWEPLNARIGELSDYGAIIAETPVALFFVFDTVLLLIYLPQALKPIHQFGRRQQWIVTIPSTAFILFHGIVMFFLTGVTFSATPPASVVDAPLLRVLTLNMHGLRYPPQHGWLPDISACRARFEAVGNGVHDAYPAYDIVSLQELYRAPDFGVITCDPSPFFEALMRPASGPFQHVLFAPDGESWMLEADGGLGLITPHTIKESRSWRFDGAGGTLNAARGILFARIAISDSPLEVDAYVVHLSPGRWRSKQRAHELELLSRVMARHSASSGNPVLLFGDFNINGSPATGGEYATILSELRHPRDVWLEANPDRPGYTYDCEHNALAQLRSCKARKRIDYIWVPTDPRFTNADRQVGVDARYGVRVIEWQTAGPTPIPVSDHYGVEALLSFGTVGSRTRTDLEFGAVVRENPVQPEIIRLSHAR